MSTPLRRSAEAAEQRTLVDVVRATARTSGDEPAIDSGAQTLTYDAFLDAADSLADELAELGIGPGDRVGVLVESGTTDLYVAIMGILVAGAAYVPVDVDDPPERARTVFAEAGVVAVVGTGLSVSMRAAAGDPRERVDPLPDDDAWVIFTSGSTGTPKGVAVRHRNAAAFVDAETQLFCRDAPLGPGDRVMAGLSVAFDASCEEMWLAWRSGACLVPAPRSLVKSGTDLGPWLVANDITVVSTVPTLLLLWPADALAQVRLLILGGEACPPEIGTRFAAAGREVWNTYGPTEATVVACAARVTADDPVRIGLPLDGWDLAVVDADGHEVAQGESGELVIGGAGLARYLDPVKDAEKYASMPTLGWDRAYRSGDIVSFDGVGLVFAGRADDQIKLGGRRIELGEVDSALLALPGVTAAGAAVRTTASGNRLLVGYLTVQEGFDAKAATAELRATMPAALVPRLAVVDTLATKTSGKIDRDALPWPLPSAESTGLTGTAGWLQQIWSDVLGATVQTGDEDFFDLGGGSLTAAQVVARIRERHPEATVADLYDHPTIASLGPVLDDMSGPAARRPNAPVHPVPVRSQLGQLVVVVAMRCVAGLKWLAWIGLGLALAPGLGIDVLPSVGWWWVPAWLLFVFPPGRVLLAAGAARIVTQGIGPGAYPRAGRVHLRLWCAERIVDGLGATALSSAALMRWYARLLGAEVGRGVDLHTVPPVTGLLSLADGCSVEVEVDLLGHWIDGGTVRVGPVRVGRDAVVGARSTLLGGAEIGADAEVAPGSAVFGVIGAGEYWSGAPARFVAPARGPIVDTPAPRRRWWPLVYAGTAVILGALPALAAAISAVGFLPWLAAATSQRGFALRVLAVAPAAALLWCVVLGLLVWCIARVQSHRIDGGVYPLHGLTAWRIWTVFRVLDEARTWLFVLYASSLTPWWLRRLGARVGQDAEASTVLLLPALTDIGEGAFLADDTMLGMYELGAGWMRVERVKIGRHAFVGNSGMAAPGRKVPKRGLVAVLSAAPRRADAKKGTSWLGSPPEQLRRRGTSGDRERTYEPATRLRVARAAIEVCRLAAVVVSALLYASVALGVLVGFGRLDRMHAALPDWVRLAATVLLAGGLLTVAGLLAAAVAVVVKRLVVGTIRVGDHPLWSSFVWRNELADAFIEVVAAPWFARHTVGTPALTAWLRLLGADIGRGVWCDTYWLPEADLISLGDGATVNRGCVVQTHLFHDRILSMDTVTLRPGATLGPHGVVLPASTLGTHATVGPASLVMRGEAVPAGTRWIGNPIAAWQSDDDPATGEQA